jgi:DNA-binding beta-propeller fold protein YncE
MQFRKSKLIFLAAALCVATPVLAETAPAGAGKGEYRVETAWKLGGEGRWDYCIVDSAARLLYVTRQSHVQVVSTESGKVVADLPGTAGAHGVALAPDLNRGFVSNGQGGSVTVFDLKENKELGKVPAGQNPDAILFDPASKHVLAFNGKSKDVTVIDAAAEPGPGAVLGHIALEGKPEFAATDGQGHVYVNLEDKNSVVAIDTKDSKITDTWKIDGGEEPSGLAIDPENHLLFAGCGGNDVMAVLDTRSGKTLGTVPIGKGVDACGFDPASHEAFASCGDGTLTVVRETSPEKFAVAQKLETRRGARTMALDPATHIIYLPTAEFAEGGNERRPTAKPDSFTIVVVSPG